MDHPSLQAVLIKYSVVFRATLRKDTYTKPKRPRGIQSYSVQYIIPAIYFKVNSIYSTMPCFLFNLTQLRIVHLNNYVVINVIITQVKDLFLSTCLGILQFILGDTWISNIQHVKPRPHYHLRLII